jgi:hypothetical protein
MPTSSGDTRALIFAAGTLVIAALLVVAVMLFATRGSEPPAEREGELAIGNADVLREDLGEGGPVYYANPFGGDGFILALADDEIVAYAINAPGRTEECHIRWKGRDDTFVDCDDEPIGADELRQYPVTVPDNGEAPDEAFVDLTRSTG